MSKACSHLDSIKALSRRFAFGWEIGFSCASRELRPPFVKLSLTLLSAFLLLMDLRRNRLDGRLTRLQPARTLDKYGENSEHDAVAAPAP